MVKVFIAVIIGLLAGQISAQAQTTTVTTSGKGSVSYPGYRTFSAAAYVAPMKNLTLLREIKSKVSSVKIADFTAEDPDMKTLVCRLSWPMYAPAQIPYAEFIAGAMRQEFSIAGLSEQEDGIEITGRLDFINFESFGTGKWIIAATFSAPGKDPVAIKHEIEFPVSFLASNACNSVRNKLVPAMQEFLFAAYSDEKFQDLLH